MSTLGRRLKEARKAAKMSQERLGIEAGLDPMSASARMNRYELGERTPDLDVVARIAKVLGVPVTYFFAESEDEATLLARLHRLTKTQRAAVMAFIDELA